jgi:DNA invertase Pin-like site-specific DNA recombinase
MRPASSRPAVIYARYSPRPGVSDSCEAQIDYCTAYCHQHRLSICEVHKDEWISGKDTDRDGLKRALEYVIYYRGVLVAYTMSRISRTLRDMLGIVDDIHKANADIVFVKDNIDTSTAMGRFTFNVFASLNELMREQAAELTRDAMQMYQKQGKRMSYLPPYGYRINKKDHSRIVKDKNEQGVIDLIIGFHRVEGMSYRAIARKLTALKIPSRVSVKKGRKPGEHYSVVKPWSHVTVRRIIMREKMRIEDTLLVEEEEHDEGNRPIPDETQRKRLPLMYGHFDDYEEPEE